MYQRISLLQYYIITLLSKYYGSDKYPDLLNLHKMGLLLIYMYYTTKKSSFYIKYMFYLTIRPNHF